MRVALVPMDVKVGDYASNVEEFRRRFGEAMEHAPDVVVFPEYCLTGFEMWDFRGADLWDEIVSLASETAAAGKVHLILGALERVGECVYNSAIVVSPEGKIILKHRKFQEPMRFCVGRRLSVAQTIWGKVAVIICGDLYNDEILGWVRRLRPDYLFVPMEYTPEYGALNDADLRAMGGRVRLMGTTTLVVNSFPPGGAWVFGRSGALIASSEGDRLLVVDV
ncbi:MAG: carbon-nitrogen hydrolase family protein [Thermotogae bacterium]|nr:carbon-nitrogen hydrolase family protein [Thermotogota bacterium]